MKKFFLALITISMLTSCSNNDDQVINREAVEFGAMSSNNSNVLYTIESISGEGLNGINFTFNVNLFAVSQPETLNTQSVRTFANAIMTDGTTRDIEGRDKETGFEPLNQTIDNYQRKELKFSISSNLIEGTIQELQSLSIEITNTDGTSTIATYPVL